MLIKAGTETTVGERSGTLRRQRETGQSAYAFSSALRCIPRCAESELGRGGQLGFSNGKRMRNVQSREKDTGSHLTESRPKEARGLTSHDHKEL